MTDRLTTYLDPNAPPKPDIDWADVEARLAALRDLVPEARAALGLVGPVMDNMAHSAPRDRNR